MGENFDWPLVRTGAVLFRGGGKLLFLCYTGRLSVCM